MSRRLSNRLILAICALACALLVGPLPAQADGVDDAQSRLNQVLDELQDLRDQMGQIDEDYSGALDRHEVLVGEIALSQVRVDEMSAVLGSVQLVLQQIAVKQFTSGDSAALSPLFSNASAYSAAEQRTALTTLAIDNGEGDVDDLHSIVDDLAAERASLVRKQEEATQLIATLEAKKLEMAELEDDYLASYAKAERELGQAKLRAAEAAREAAAQARDQLVRAAQARVISAIPRGGGSGPRYTGPVPAVSGSAGIAVAAAYSQIGVPYKFATSTPGVSFDCSGLTKWVWAQAGVSLPHQSRAQFAITAPVPRDQIQPGDLIFYYSPISHVSIYVGNGMLIHAPNTGSFVGLSTVKWHKVVGVGRPG
ncbi:MAG: NlpC/P60 family protein [Ilumatobacteraceae bacterium]